MKKNQDLQEKTSASQEEVALKQRPPHHPQTKVGATGVLLINLGTPEKTDYFAVRRYLNEFLSDRRVIDYPSYLWQPLLKGVILTSRPLKAGRAYKKIWNTKKNESPLKSWTRSLADKISLHLQNENEEKDALCVDWSMRYGHPAIAQGIKNLQARGCRKILFFALYPQYSATTTASAYDKAFSALGTVPWQPAVRTAPSWHDDPGYINLLALSLTENIQNMPHPPEVVLASFHGLPQRYLTQGDPYYCQCKKTSRLLRERLGWPEERWVTSFQSRFGPEKWLQPYTDTEIKRLAEAGVKSLAVISPAFVTDCLETLEELAIGGRESFIEYGGTNFYYIPCLNDSDAQAAFLAGLIRRELQGWLP